MLRRGAAVLTLLAWLYGSGLLVSAVDLLPPDREEYVDTVGGLVFSLAGRVPTRGEIIAHSGGLEFEVVDVDARRLKRVRVRKTKPAST